MLNSNNNPAFILRTIEIHNKQSKTRYFQFSDIDTAINERARLISLLESKNFQAAISDWHYEHKMVNANISVGLFDVRNLGTFVANEWINIPQDRIDSLLKEMLS